MQYLYQSLGSLLYYIYSVIPDYGISIIIFTIFIKLILLPIAIKQQRAMAGMQKIQPQIEEIRKKYKNDMNKINEETMKLYAEHKVNPFSSCLPTLIQLPIFIALYQVITHPIEYILRYTSSQLLAVNHAINYLIQPQKITVELQIIKESEGFAAQAAQSHISVVNYIINRFSELPQYQITHLLGTLKGEGIAQISDVAKLIANINSSLSMNFLGLFNLTEQPNIYHLTPVILIPIFAAITTYFSSKMMTSMTPTAADNPTQNTMMIMMPLFTLYIGFKFPAGLGLYWVISNVIQMIQQYLLNKYIPKEGVSSK